MGPTNFRSISHNALNKVLLVIAIILSSACSTFDKSEKTSKTNQSFHLTGSFGDPQRHDRPTRSSAVVESSVGLLRRSLVADPIVRPFSTLKAFYGYTLKSTTGFLERAFIQNVRFPLLERKPIPGLTNNPPMDLADWELELDQITGTRLTRGSISLLVDGEEYFERLYESIDGSDKSISIRTYIFDNDDVALELADRLRERSKDVEVKIMVDGLADIFATRIDSPSMPADVDLPPSMSDYITYESRVAFRKQSNPWFTGDHVKITLIDEDVAFIGGMNIGREYRYDWHDLMMEVKGPIIAELQHDFEQSWIKAGPSGDFGWLLRNFQGYEPDLSGEGYPIRILTTSIHDSKLYRAQIAAARRAQNYIYLQNAYFSDDKLLFELARARRRGVDVRVIVASSSDSGILDLSNHKTINTMLRNGIRVYAYPGMTHVKAAIYDGWACLGSANFDKLSLQVNRELNLATSEPAFVTELLGRVFVPDFEVSTELREIQPVGARHHLAEFVADEFF